MGYDGAGNYNRQRNFSGDASANIKILASAMDEEFNDFASAMTLPLLRDGQNSPTANIPMGGFTFTNVGAPSSASNYVRAQDFISNVPIYMEDGESSADNISVSASFFTTASAGASPVGGTKVIIKMGSNKGSAPAIHLNTGDGNPHSANVVLQNGGALYSGAIYSGGIYEFIFASAASVWQLMNPTQIAADTDSLGLIEIATTAEANTGTDTSRAITPATLKTVITSANAATTASAGVIEIATTAEVSGGTDTDRAVTPAAMRAVNASVSAVVATSIDNAMPYLALFHVATGSGSARALNDKASAWVLQSAGSAGVHRVVHNIGLTSAEDMIIQILADVGETPTTGGAVVNLASIGASSFTFRATDFSGSALENIAFHITTHVIP